MSNFGKWIRATWPETMKASRLSERTNDLANLAAQLEEALTKFKKRYPKAITGEAAIDAVAEFMEKYES